MPAPAYNSYKWIQEDWRYLKFRKGLFDDIADITYDKRCGEREKDGKVRLCLPKIVIVRMLRSQRKRKALEQQMKKKLNSKKKKVSWNDLVKKEMKKYREEQKSIKDDPTKRKRIISRNRTKPNVWHVEYVQRGSELVIQNKFYPLAEFKAAEKVRAFFDKKMKEKNIKYKIKKIDRSYNTYYK
jgi:hypothetical protein